MRWVPTRRLKGLGWWCAAGVAFAVASPDSAARGQETTLHVSQDVTVGARPDGMLLIEPHLAAHPTDPNRLLAVAITTTPDYAEEYCLVFASSDAGATWNQQRPEGRGCGDPWLTLTGERAVLTALATHPDLPTESNQLLAYLSKDGGSSWPWTPQSLGTGHDGPRTIAASDGTIYVTSGKAARDRTTGYGLNAMFLGWLGSTRSWIDSRPEIVPSNLNQGADGAAVLSDGTLVYTYSDFQRPVGGPERAFRGRAGAVERRRTWAMTSRDDGRTFSHPLLVTESCFGRPTFLAADASDGPYRDRMYHVCPGTDLKTILVMSSATAGWEWTDAMPIEEASTESRMRHYPVIAVNNEGTVAIAWMDQRDDGPSHCYAPYFTASRDGGETFSRPVRLASAVSCPDTSRTGRAGSRFPMGGDYFGLVGAADGRFHIVWPDARDGMFGLRTASVRVGG